MTDYKCETEEDCDNFEAIAAHYGLDAKALRAATEAQSSFSALGMARPLVAYMAALSGELGQPKGESDA